MNEAIVMWAEIVAFAIIGLYLIAKPVVNKPNNRIRAIFEKMLAMVIITGFCCLLYIAIRGIYDIIWLSYLLIAMAGLLLLILRGKYLRDIKEAATIVMGTSESD